MSQGPEPVVLQTAGPALGFAPIGKNRRLLIQNILVCVLLMPARLHIGYRFIIGHFLAELTVAHTGQNIETRRQVMKRYGIMLVAAVLGLTVSIGESLGQSSRRGHRGRGDRDKSVKKDHDKKGHGV